MQTDRWDPAQYNKFREQRMLPFFDLVALIQPASGMRVIDLGCGTGELTAMLAERLPDARIEGIDSSAAMLEQALPRENDRLKFRLKDMTEAEDYSSYDLIFSHAALQWVQENEQFVGKVLRQMKPGAQIAVQVPKNESHPSHRIAAELAKELPFRDLLGGYVSRGGPLSLERYAELLYSHGLRDQVCIEKIYGHELTHSSDVVEWVKGTLLTPYLSRLSEASSAVFLAAYRERLLAAIGDRSPYFYPFRRLLFWGKKVESL